MHRKCGVIFCGNEHGCGEVTFPDLNSMSITEMLQRFVDSAPESKTRREAKAAGWKRVNGEDYCPLCVESGL